MKTILLIGKDGQVGWELQRALAPLGRVVAMGRAGADLENPAALDRLIDDVAPDIIVNAAAYTAVDNAEDDRERARIINADAVAVLARGAKKYEAWLVHYSTDYVYDGRKDGSYTEEDATNPLGVYGATKLAGEQAIVASGANHLIFRTSWVYALRGRNFIHTILKHATDKDQLKIVSDQFGAPTSAELIADVTALALSKVTSKVTSKATSAQSGVYHLVARGRTSWHAYATYFLDLARQAGLPVRVAAENVLPVSSSEYPVKAERPKNSSLCVDKIEKAFDLALPEWQYHVQRMIQEVSKQ